MALIQIKLPKSNESVVKQIESLFDSNKVAKSNLKVEMMSNVVDKADINRYIELLLRRQFKDASETVKTQIESIEFDALDSFSFAFPSSASQSCSTMTLMASKKGEDNKYKIFIYYYEKSAQFTTYNAFLRWMLGYENPNTSLLTENNVKQFMVYKLAKYATEFNNDVQILFTDSGNTKMIS